MTEAQAESSEPAGRKENAESGPDLSLLPDAERLGLDYAITTCIVTRYDGQLLDEQYHGPGKATFANGARYTGDFLKGFMHGHGEYTWADGTMYAGDFVYNRITGSGRYVWPSGNVYEGQVLDGKRHGNGRFALANDPTVFEGEWRNGKRNGFGTCYYDIDKKEFFTGQWKDDVRSGNGKMVYLSGNDYDGEWLNNLRDGKGVMRWVTTNEMYSGMWKEGRQHGHGLHIWFLLNKQGSPWQMQNSYDGEFANGERSGFGVFMYADGSKYAGEWASNVKHGHGTFTFADGEVYVGRFERDRFVDYVPGETQPIGTGVVAEQSTIVAHTETSLPSGVNKIDVPPPEDAGRKKGKGTLYGGIDLPLYIDDILKYERNAENELLRTRNLILQFNSELRQIFRYYSRLQSPSTLGRGSMPLAGRLVEFHPSLIGEQAKENVFSMSMIQFWKFTKDTKLPDHNLTLAAIDRIFLRLKQGQVEPVSKDRPSLGNVHNPEQAIVFREFVEAVVRLADIKCADADALSDRLMKTLQEFILPYACKDSQHFYRQQLNRPDVQDVLKRHEPFITSAFCRLAAATPAAGTVTIQVFVRFLRDSGLCGGGGGDKAISVTQAVDLLLRVNDDDDEYVAINQINLNIELIFSEFVEGLVRTADLIYREKVSDVAERIERLLQHLEKQANA